MWVFLSAGILYLVGVALVLVWKPNLMFTPDGQWKEFGIGQDTSRYSPFPFWLFCFTWAIVSYTIVVILTAVVDETKSGLNIKKFTSSVSKKNTTPIQELNAVDFSEGTEGLPNGYYILNKKATRLTGMPKYVFIGPSPPSS